MSEKFGAGAKTEDMPGMTAPGARGGRGGATVAAPVVPVPAAVKQGTPAGAFDRRGPAGAFEALPGALGSDLVPDFGKRVEQKTRRFWIGTLPSCPKAVVHIGGQDFPDYCDPEIEIGGGQRRRAYQLGVLRDLTDAKVVAIQEGIRRRFVRGSDIYCLPTVADIATMKAAGRPVEWPQPGDDALARHIYMIETDVRGDTYPPSVYETGLSGATPAK